MRTIINPALQFSTGNIYCKNFKINCLLILCVQKKKLSDFYCMWKRKSGFGKKNCFLYSVIQINVFHFSSSHWIVCPSSIYGFRLHLWDLQAIFALFLKQKRVCHLTRVRLCAVTLYHCWRRSKQVCLKVPWHWQKKLIIINLMWQETLHQCMS